MHQDQMAEAKRVYAKLNASRPPQLKVNASDPLERQIVPGFTPRSLPVFNTTVNNVASLPSFPLFKNLQNHNSCVYGTNSVGRFIGGTYGVMFHGFCNNFFIPMQQYPVPIVHYHGNVTINNNYTYPSNHNSVSTITDDKKRPFNPYCTKTSPIRKPTRRTLFEPSVVTPNIRNTSNEINYDSIYEQVDEEELCKAVQKYEEQIEPLDISSCTVNEQPFNDAVGISKNDFKNIFEMVSEEEQRQFEIDPEPEETFSLPSNFSDDSILSLYNEQFKY